MPVMQPMQIVERPLGPLNTIIDNVRASTGRRSPCRLVDRREEGASAGGAATEGTQAAEGAELTSRVRWRFPTTSCEKQ